MLSWSYNFVELLVDFLSNFARFDLNGATHTMTEEGHSLATTTFPLPTYSSMGVSTQEDDSDDKQRVEGDSRKLSPRSKVTDSCCKSKDQQNRFFAGDEKSSPQGTKRLAELTMM